MEYIFNIGSTDSPEYNYFRLELTLKETAVNKQANTSTVAYCLRLYSGSRYFYGYGMGAKLLLDGKVVASRDRQTEPAVSMERYGCLDILQGEITLSHNQNGKLQIPVAFSMEMTAGDYTPGSMSGTGELLLTEISRLSGLRATSAHIGEVSMVAITRQSAQYSHSVRYAFGRQSGYLSGAGEVVAEEEIFREVSFGFVVPESFYDEIPQAAGGVCTLEITTYHDTVALGKETAEITITANPALCAPQAQFAAVDCNPVTLALTGDAGKLIAGYSQVQCLVEAQGQKGAEILSVAVNGSRELEFPATTPQLQLTVTDSRGFVTAKSLNMPMVEYTEPTCNVTAQRTDPTSGQVRVQVWGQYFGGSFGAAENTISVICRLPSGAEQALPVTVSENAYRGEAVLDDLSYQTGHTIQVIVRDALCQLLRSATVNRGMPVFDWGQKDFAFRVPVTVEGSINGISMGAASGSALWLVPETLPQSFLIAGGGVLGMLTVRKTDCLWQGSEGVTALRSEQGAGLLFPEETDVMIFSGRNYDTN